MNIFQTFRKRKANAIRLINELEQDARELDIENLKKREYIFNKGVSEEELNAHLSKNTTDERLENPEMEDLVANIHDVFSNLKLDYVTLVEISALLTRFINEKGWTADYEDYLN